MKVLFLDIDGVLNSSRSCLAFGGFPHGFTPEHMEKFDHVALALIRRLCRETKAQCVLSSSWRILHPFLEVGQALDLPIIDATPKNGPSRGSEIAQWLENNVVEKYAIVDDDSDMLPEQKPFFVQTPHADGLQWDQYEHLKHILEAKP